MFKLSARLIVTTATLLLAAPPINAHHAKNKTKTPNKFSVYKPSYVMAMQRPNDDEALAVRASIKYQLMDCKERESRHKSGGVCGRILNNKGFLGGHWKNSSVFFSYTTDFDFYVFGDSEQGRPSRPVVNRMTSPGLHLRLKAKDSDEKHRLNNVWLSLVHHSNGQSRDKDNFDPELPNTESYWRDGLSRGWNYVELKFDSFHYFRMKESERSKKCNTDSRCWSNSVALKFPISSHDDEIWWGESRHPGSYLEHNRIEWTLSTETTNTNYKNIRGWQFSTQLQCGQRGCGMNTWIRADIEFNNLTLPFMVYAHSGRNEHFYNYTDKNNYIGIGFQFRP